MRAVLDPNVIISALLSPEGAPARSLRAWLEGEFELVVSPLLLEELARALSYPKLRKHIGSEEARRIVDLLASSARVAADPKDRPRIRSADPADDYLIALAEAESAALVSGDDHLLGLVEELPVYPRASFLDLLKVDRGE